MTKLAAGVEAARTTDGSPKPPVDRQSTKKQQHTDQTQDCNNSSVKSYKCNMAGTKWLFWQVGECCFCPCWAKLEHNTGVPCFDLVFSGQLLASRVVPSLSCRGRCWTGLAAAGTADRHNRQFTSCRLLKVGASSYECQSVGFISLIECWFAFHWRVLFWMVFPCHGLVSLARVWWVCLWSQVLCSPAGLPPVPSFLQSRRIASVFLVLFPLLNKTLGRSYHHVLACSWVLLRPPKLNSNIEVERDRWCFS